MCVINFEFPGGDFFYPSYLEERLFLPLKMKESWDDIPVPTRDWPSAPVYMMLREHLNVSNSMRVKGNLI